MQSEFYWAELMTTAAAGAQTFYAELFGWRATPGVLADDPAYSTMRLGEEAACGLFQMADSLKAQRVPSHWTAHVLVTDADAASARATALGGSVVSQPFAVGDAGRMAMLQDPTGALVNVWEIGEKLHFSKPLGLGRPVWFELATSDLAAASAFYAGLFGWQIGPSDPGDMRYTALLSASDEPLGAMLQLPPAWQRIPSHWLPYFSVCDAATTAQIALRSGGLVMRGATDGAHGRFAVLRDPQAAVFGIIETSG